jgi:hypothetical protein
MWMFVHFYHVLDLGMGGPAIREHGTYYWYAYCVSSDSADTPEYVYKLLTK